MQFLTKACTLSLIITGLTACGGSDDDKKQPSNTPSSSSSLASSSALSSSSLASSSKPASSSISSSSTLSSSSQSSSSSSLAVSEKTFAATSHTGFSVAEIENCGVNITAANKTYTFFADYETGMQNQSSGFSGWNHATNNSATEWINLKHPGATYDFNSAAEVNDSCNGTDSLNIVLVKKIADWDRQHANGFEKSITADGKKFSDVENLTLDLKINSDKTSIPTVAAIKSTYSSYLSDANTTVDALESGQVNIGIVIYDGKVNPTYMAKTIIQLDQTTLSDKWVRVIIPMATMKHCLEANYSCADKPFSELSDKIIAGIQFVAETKSGAVLRGNIPTWSTNPPVEAFKEVDLSIKKIEFQLK